MNYSPPSWRLLAIGSMAFVCCRICANVKAFKL